MHFSLLLALLVLSGCTSLQEAGLLNSKEKDYLKAELIVPPPTAFKSSYKTHYDIPHTDKFSANEAIMIAYPMMSFQPRKSMNSIRSIHSVEAGQNVMGQPMIKVRLPLDPSFKAAMDSLGAYSWLSIDENKDYRKLISLTYGSTPIRIEMMVEEKFTYLTISPKDDKVYLKEQPAVSEDLMKFEEEFRTTLIQELNKINKRSVYGANL